MLKQTFLILAVLVAYVHADCYMHNPRGSNDRLNGAAANRANGNRLFDSQNNNRGGYNACDKGDAAAANNANRLYYKSATRGTSNPQDIYDETGDRNEAVQYPMMYYAGSTLQMEWTVQHGCGGNEATDPNKLNCNMVIQYMCDQEVKKPNGQTDLALSVNLADGLNTNTPDSAGNNNNNCDDDNLVTTANVIAQMDANDAASRGRHESEGWYCECQQRSRDLNLFTADQNLNGGEAQYTRQNPNGNRRGLECAEERDYWPYMAPSPFRDLAVLTDDTSRCSIVQTANGIGASQNVAPRGKCYGNQDGFLKGTINAITQAACTGTWQTVDYGLLAPDCVQASYSRVNHLGNGRGDGVSPETVGYNATLPTWATLTENTKIAVKTYPAATNDYAKCILRLRYNVSTDDYDPWSVDAGSNNDGSPVTQNPLVNIGGSAQLQIALNTNQYGRTFQDRSHVFFLKKPTGAVEAAMTAGRKIVNLNVRGKRGNIVQTFPATEYDFVPTNAEAAPGDLVHIQYCGSNTHNNGNPAGDGQAGDAGEGTGGTDRHNLVMMKDFDDNFPAPWGKLAPMQIPDLFGNTCMGANMLDQTPLTTPKDCAVRGATSGFYMNAGGLQAENMNATLDNTPASTVGGGMIVVIPDSATVGMKYRYMGTRNNNFTNRGMKGELNVVSGSN